MVQNENKQKLRVKYLIPKVNLAAERRRNGWTTEEAAGMIGISRRQYEMKERGQYPFNDYEMLALAQKFNKSINYLFFEK
ncbi:MAG TPA: helix-turn-helix transcriptional regulator [Lapidilactobacillus dextrinicus]|uniref:Helix-turn-helix transcriptional regulator n=1 Tax=Lapidilactobacillus dextrinicus TaxID=51664 RepID=A0A921DW64_9LACO|nr:helix-turn-helix transcriptional regulator [Lapidilactobacillus dextrinicus]